MKRTPVLHPFLLAAVPVLFLFAHNSRKLYVSRGELVLPLAAAVGFALLAWLGLRRLLRSGPRAGLVVTLFLLLFFLYGHVAGALRQTGNWYRDWQLGAAFLVIFAAGSVLVARSRREFRGLTVFLNFTAAILAALNLATSLPALAAGGPRRAAAGRAQGDEPDIYYIILDGHARSDVLADIYGYDNSWFIDSLRARGFHVADRARANYGQTYLSIGSTLNMDYADSLAEALGRESDNREPLVRWLLENRVMGELRGRGYRIVSFASGYSGTEFVNADLHLAPKWAASEFLNLLIGLTPVGSLLAAFTSRSQFDLHRQRAEYILDRLPAAGRVPGPTFVFAHLLPPHPPFVFGAAGERLPASGPFNLSDGNHYHHGEPEAVVQYVEGYRRQVEFIDRRILRTLDEIVAGAERPPVIVLQADHGPGSRLNHDDPRWTDFAERLGILSAVLLPDRDYTGWHDSLTPVNTFRLVFNRLFGDTLAVLPDRSYFATWDRPYEHIDIDGYRASATEVPAAVGVVAFRQAATQPADPDLYFARLVGRKLPGTKVGPVLLYLVDTLPTLDEAFARYRAAVAGGEIRDLGAGYEQFRGHHGSDWRKVLALFFPVPGRVSVVAFRFAADPPADPPGYIRALVEESYPGSTLGEVFIAPARAMTADEAFAAYRAAVAAGRLPELGTNPGRRVGTGPDGAGVVALFFPAGR